MSQLKPLSAIARAGDLMFRETPSQTAGPYVHIGLALSVAGLPQRDMEIWNQLATEEAEGERIALVGTVIDGNGDVVRDIFVEAWQANARGEYCDEYSPTNAFNGFGRAAPDVLSDGEWSFDTIKPGCVKDSRGQWMAPHVALSLFARGINLALHTRLYFEDEAQANASCPVLNAVESPQRRQTMIARRDGERHGVPCYRLDIRLQGEGETVFFDF
ncbi:protocatechuate 3,4-dioxygenase subunit alpha [Larsenimonas rhizosphaerae]|uniref:Protocatechuate 3,4-dioxygenase subunit alpha n=1 Tax=Larsenimonas rhizosphaerae TaxID=2944682 RepID=A0AA41ZH39_9GAMM|nr:protocatechuate 3,4-dioxygenase subunit alpha [Larsenimonas rhizosphaerae]MCX2525144.1 protocatechuate 3,4-dioxygenase subunit alpha [Larsenimonas rhizosphaerae]